VSFEDPRFFLNPVLVGRSLFQRMRAEGSAALAIGPVCESAIVLMPSSDLQKVISDTSVQGLSETEVRPFCERCNTLLAHLGVPFKFDQPIILLTDDAAETLTAIVHKVNALESAYPNGGVSDLYLRMAMVYWYAYHGILLRTASKKWAESKGEYLYSKAAEYLSKIPSNDDLRSIADYNAGILAMDAHKWADAEGHLSNALLQFPSDQRIVKNLAKAHLELGNPMEAMARIDEAISSEETAELWVMKGRVLRNMRMLDESLECFNRALSMDPKYIEAHDQIIATLRELGRAEDASFAERQRAMAKTPDLDQRVSDLINELKKASAEPTTAHRVRKVKPPPPEKAPEPVTIPSYPIELAREAAKSGNYDSAIQMAEHILREDPTSRDAQLVLIESLVVSGELARASAASHAFYESNRDDPKAWYWRGVVADKEGKWGAAVQYFSKAVTLDPSYVEAWFAMGGVLLSNEKVSGADESFSRVLQLNPNDAGAWLGKAKAMRHMGRWGAAIQCFDKYNTLEPKDRDAWLVKADLLFEKEKYRRAVDAYDRYLAMDQDDSYALGRKGIALNAIGVYDDARKCLEEAVRLDPGNREAAKWLASLGSGGEM
jgi:tetratricopeptide (TPR) repeat protein